MKNKKSLAHFVKEKNRVIRELKKEVAMLRRLAVVDELTGVYNRRYLHQEIDRITNEMGVREKRKKLKITGFSVLFFDLDHFKRINDAFGHDIGDTMLVAFARLLEKSFREFDRIGRWGGEEFVVLMLGASEKDALKKAELIRRIFAKQQIKTTEGPAATTVSVGICQLRQGMAGHDVVRRADEAMYNAKRERNKVCVF